MRIFGIHLDFVPDHPVVAALGVTACAREPAARDLIQTAQEKALADRGVLAERIVRDVDPPPDSRASTDVAEREAHYVVGTAAVHIELVLRFGERHSARRSASI